MGYSRKILSYPEKVILYNLTYMMSMTNLVAISIEIVEIDNRCSLDKEFI